MNENEIKKQDRRSIRCHAGFLSTLGNSFLHLSCRSVIPDAVERKKERREKRERERERERENLFWFLR